MINFSRHAKPLLISMTLGLPLIATMSSSAIANDDPRNGFRPHTAVYDIGLSNKEDRASNIRGADGRLVYELGGNVCEGFTVNVRFVLNFAGGNNDVISDQQTTTYESGDGKNYRFASKVLTNRKLEREVIGSANLVGDKTNIALRKPEKESLSLDASIFPTQHLADIITAARAGDTFVRAAVFDGSDEGTESYFTQTVVGKAKTGVADDNAEAVVLPADLAATRFWPVTVGYFKHSKSADGELQPFYQVSFKLYESGISRDLEMDYEDFSLQGTLKDLTLKPMEKQGDC